MPLPNVAQLREHIGKQVLHHGIRCQVLEVLEDMPALVLLDIEHNTKIQDNQFGDPQRRVPSTYTVPLWTGQQTLHPDFVQLGLLPAD